MAAIPFARGIKCYACHTMARTLTIGGFKAKLFYQFARFILKCYGSHTMPETLLIIDFKTIIARGFYFSLLKYLPILKNGMAAIPWQKTLI